MSNLSQFQQKLINELTNEFKKLNPQTKTDNGVKRFSLSSIENCINEEEKFIQTISKHNLTMIKVFLNQFKEDLKNFKKEFGKVLDIQIGYLPNCGYSYKYTLEEFESESKKRSANIANHTEMYLFIVSKTKVFDMGDSRYNYCNNKSYQKIYISFKTTSEDVVLESGKLVRLQKIVGLNYSNYDYLTKFDTKINSATLDGLIQASKSIQQRLVALVK